MGGTTGIKPRSERETIYQGDDLDRLVELDGAVEAAGDALRRAQRAAKAAEGGLRLQHEDSPETDVIAAQEALDLAQMKRDEFAAEAEERGVVVVLRPINGREWKRLKLAHPPRRDGAGEYVADDATFGVNMDEFPYEALPVSIDPEVSTIEGAVTEFLEELDIYNFDRLTLAMMRVNRSGSSADPTRRLASASR